MKNIAHHRVHTALSPGVHHAVSMCTCDVVDRVETDAELPDFKRIFGLVAQLQVLDSLPVLFPELSVVVRQQGRSLKPGNLGMHQGAPSVLAVVQVEANHSGTRIVRILNDLLHSERITLAALIYGAAYLEDLSIWVAAKDALNGDGERRPPLSEVMTYCCSLHIELEVQELHSERLYIIVNSRATFGESIFFPRNDSRHRRARSAITHAHAR